MGQHRSRTPGKAKQFAGAPRPGKRLPLRQGISTLLTALMLVIVAITVVSVSTPGIARAQGEAPGRVPHILGAAQLAEGKELTVSLPTEPIVAGEGDGAVEMPVTFTLTGDTDTFAGAIVIYQAPGCRPTAPPSTPATGSTTLSSGKVTVRSTISKVLPRRTWCARK